MEFAFTEEQKILRSTVREFAESRLAPVADKLDQAGEFATENFKAMAGIGLTGMRVPAKYGGNEVDNVSVAIIAEELARACASTCNILIVHAGACTELVYRYGNEEQRRRFIPPLARGEKIGSFAITEAEAGSDATAVQCTAVKDGGSYILNGTKVFITNGTVCDTAVVFARVPEMGKRGITAFVVENGMPGFSKGKKYHKLGMRAATNCDLVFEDCRVPAANRLGEEGQGMKICLATLDYGRIGVAALALGIAQAVLEKSIQYSKQRVQFGAPISQNQAIAWMLADMATGLESARLLTYKAASLADHGEPFTLCAAMAKLAASELCMQASIKGVQIHGGYGYMMDSPMQRYMREAKLVEIYEGTSEIQRMVISRTLLQ